MVQVLLHKENAMSLPRYLLVALLIGSTSAAVAGKKPAPVACPGGRFVIEGPRLVGAQREVGGDAIVVADDGSVSIDSGCEPVPGQVKAARKATVVKARWKSCAGLAGKVRLTARIDAATCSTLHGSATVKRQRRRVTGRKGNLPIVTPGSYTEVPLAQATVGADGGTIAVTDPTSPLAGLVIEIPPGAAPEPVTFTVEYADVVAVTDLPPGAAVVSKAIRIRAAGSERFNAYRLLDLPATVTLPYAPPTEGEEWVRFYARVADGALESAGFVAQDVTNHTVTFLLRAFGDVVPELSVPAPQQRAAAPQPRIDIDEVGAVTLWAISWVLPTPNPMNVVNTGFSAAANGWNIPNEGSYYAENRGGSCLGMSAVAKHYFQKGFSPPLRQAYLDNWPNVSATHTPTWVDDVVAIEYATRVQYGLNGSWRSLADILASPISASGVMRTIVAALWITRRPVVMRVTESFVDVLGRLVTEQSHANHAVLIYRATVPQGYAGNVVFATYDPNHPGDERRIVWNSAAGFDPFPGNDDGSGPQYNNFTILGYYAAVTSSLLDDVKAAADQSFRNDSIIPRITITSIRGASDDEPAKDDVSSLTGEHKFVTADTAVRIQGTILGGLAQSFCCAVDSAAVIVGWNVYSTAVNNGWVLGDGAFDVTVPIPQGENEVAIIAGRYEPWVSAAVDYWAGYYRNVIESTASPGALTIELSWLQDDSDVDLYVQEPDGPAGSGKIGDTVYYAHRRGTSAEHPYLDLDDTSGRGPEHYYAKVQTKTLYRDGTEAQGLLGDYTVKVHYYADHDADADRDQPVNWTIRWRYLSYCPDPCANPEKDGRWKEGSRSGQISEANGSNAGDITHTGPDWSDPIVITYAQEPPPPAPPRQANLP